MYIECYVDPSKTEHVLENFKTYIEVYKGDFIFVGGCEYENVTSFGTLIYKITHFAIKKNNFFLIRHWRIPEIISMKENLSTSNKSWSDFIDIVSHKFLVRVPMNKSEKMRLTNSEFTINSVSPPGNDLL